MRAKIDNVIENHSDTSQTNSDEFADFLECLELMDNFYREELVREMESEGLFSAEEADIIGSRYNPPGIV